MIARIELHRAAAGGSDASGLYDYRVLTDGDLLYEESGFQSVVQSLVAAVEGLPPSVRAVEVACGGVVSGTYPLQVLAGHVDEVAQHAVNTTAAVFEALSESE
jgi:hypothetical protein